MLDSQKPINRRCPVTTSPDALHYIEGLTRLLFWLVVPAAVLLILHAALIYGAIFIWG